MLQTHLAHLTNDDDMQKVLADNANVMVCCGRMGPMCIPVYRAMERLEPEFTHVAFRDMEFDIPAADFIKNQPKCSSFMGLPFVVYFRNGEAVVATSSIQNKDDMAEILHTLYDED